VLGNHGIYANDIGLARRYAAQATKSFKQTELYPTYICWAVSLEAMFTSLAGDFDGALALAQDALSRFGSGGQYFLLDVVQVVAAMLAQRGRRREAALLIGGLQCGGGGKIRPATQLRAGVIRSDDGTAS
jgi:ATP/maltotriose-dependent transcriptional regulator MalT